jgi:hypothetical protein
MNKELLFPGLEVHAQNIALACAEGGGGEARSYGAIPQRSARPGARSSLPPLHALERGACAQPNLNLRQESSPLSMAPRPRSASPDLLVMLCGRLPPCTDRTTGGAGCLGGRLAAGQPRRGETSGSERINLEVAASTQSTEAEAFRRSHPTSILMTRRVTTTQKLQLKLC